MSFTQDSEFNDVPAVVAWKQEFKDIAAMVHSQRAVLHTRVSSGAPTGDRGRARAAAAPAAASHPRGDRGGDKLGSEALLTELGTGEISARDASAVATAFPSSPSELPLSMGAVESSDSSSTGGRLSSLWIGSVAFVEDEESSTSHRAMAGGRISLSQWLASPFVLSRQSQS